MKNFMTSCLIVLGKLLDMEFTLLLLIADFTA